MVKMPTDPRLRLARATIDKELAFLATTLTNILPGRRHEYFFQVDTWTRLVARLTSRDFPLTVSRDMGGETPVVSLLTRERDVERYWLSLVIIWNLEPGRGGPFIYHTAGITIFQGAAREADKLQLLRAEWAGLRKLDGGVFEFEAAGAAHPHWQIDAMRHQLQLRRRHEEEREALRRELEVEAAFSTLDELLGSVRQPNEIRPADGDDVAWTRMHLALSAPWDREPWIDRSGAIFPHARSPSTFGEVRNWISSAVLYIQQEIARTER